MPKTFAQLNKEIAALQAEAKKLYAVELKGVVNKINDLIAQHSLSPDDLKFATHSAMPSKSSPAQGRSDRSTQGSAKYSDAQGHTWGGRGPRPAWLRSAIEAGASLESFQRTGDSAEISPSASSGRAAPASKAIGKRPAKYKDDSGNSWSGRGSRPRWLLAALKKRGTKVEDFLIDPSNAGLGKATSSSAAETSLPAKKSRKTKPAAAAQAATVGTGGSSKAVSSSARRMAPGKKAARTGSTQTAGRASAVKQRKSAQSAASQGSVASAGRRTALPSAKPAAKRASNPVAKPNRKTASSPAPRGAARPAHAKSAASAKAAAKAPKRPAATKQAAGRENLPPSAPAVMPVAATETSTLSS